MEENTQQIEKTLMHNKMFLVLKHLAITEVLTT